LLKSNKVIMKELEKTKRISVAAVLFILIIIIALLSYKKPKHLYDTNTASTLERVINYDYFVTLEEINDPNFVLIDIRGQHDFNKGHLENAINIASSDILSDSNSEIFKDLKENGKTIVLLGTNPSEVNGPFIVLYQLGYTNLKILTVELNYSKNRLVVNNSKVEDTVADVNAFIAASQKKAAVVPKKPKKKKAKKVVPVKKKKKMPVEGGC